MNEISSTLAVILAFYLVALLASKSWVFIEREFGFGFIEEVLSVDRVSGSYVRIIIYVLILFFIWFGPGLFATYGSDGFRVSEAKVAISRLFLTPIFLLAIFMAARRIIFISRAK